MKKVLLLILVIALTFCLVGCGVNESNSNPEENLPQTGDQEENEPVEIQPREENEIAMTKYFPEEDLNKYEIVQVLQLDENPTTGYGWQYTIDDDTVAVVESDEYTTNQNNEGIAGVGGIHAYRISGIKEGETAMTFKYMRSWEGEESAVQTVSFKISVDSDMKVAITEEIHE